MGVLKARGIAMTEQEAVKCAAALECDGNSPATVERDVLHMLANVATKHQKQTVINGLLFHCEHFRHASQPGHQVWYPHYLRMAAWAIEAFK